MYTMLINNVTWVMQPILAEGAFFQFGIYLVLCRRVCKNLVNMMQVFFPSLVVNENFIHIHHYKFIGEWSQDIIHHPNESGWTMFSRPKGMTNHSKIGLPLT
jgi:hypothetical protein